MICRCNYFQNKNIILICLLFSIMPWPKWFGSKSSTSQENVSSNSSRYDKTGPSFGPRFAPRTSQQSESYTTSMQENGDMRYRLRTPSRIYDCVICSSHLNTRKTKTLTCQHVFHEACIEYIFLWQNSCPTCEVPIDKKNDKNCKYCEKPVPKNEVNLPCGHAFHKKCVGDSLYDFLKCPSCEALFN